METNTTPADAPFTCTHCGQASSYLRNTGNVTDQGELEMECGRGCAPLAGATLENGIHGGMFTAGPDSVNTLGREQRDRIRAAWLNSGLGDTYAWPDDVKACGSQSSNHDLALAAVILMAYHPVDRPRHGSIRLVGEAHLAGRVTDGMALLPHAAGGAAVSVGTLASLPGLLAVAAGA